VLQRNKKAIYYTCIEVFAGLSEITIEQNRDLP